MPKKGKPPPSPSTEPPPSESAKLLAALEPLLDGDRAPCAVDDEAALEVGDARALHHIRWMVDERLEALLRRHQHKRLALETVRKAFKAAAR